jgi:ATP-dependent Clp protease ATP-binding subunit ClpC
MRRFTEKCRRGYCTRQKTSLVIMLAQEEARRLGHNFVGTEQILLGLIGEGTGVAAKVLKSMGVNLKDARIEVEKIIGRGSGFVAVEIPFTPRAKRVLELSLEEARQLGHNYIGTEHLLLGLIREGGAIDAANILKPALARGELQCIGATTLDEYRKHIERDAALERRFQPVMVGEPTVEETIEILYGLRERYEQHHKLKILDEALEAAAKLSDRYISDRYLPDKAIDLVDEAGSRVRLINSQLPPAAKELDKELREVLKQKDDAVRAQDFDKAGELRDREMEIKEQIRSIASSKKTEAEGGGPMKLYKIGQPWQNEHFYCQ